MCVCARARACACVCGEGVERRSVGSTFTASVTTDFSEQDTKPLTCACSVSLLSIVSPASAKP